MIKNADKGRPGNVTSLLIPRRQKAWGSLDILDDLRWYFESFSMTSINRFSRKQRLKEDKKNENKPGATWSTTQMELSRFRLMTFCIRSRSGKQEFHVLLQLYRVPVANKWDVRSRETTNNPKQQEAYIYRRISMMTGSQKLCAPFSRIVIIFTTVLMLSRVSCTIDVNICYVFGVLTMDCKCGVSNANMYPTYIPDPNRQCVYCWQPNKQVSHFDNAEGYDNVALQISVSIYHGWRREIINYLIPGLI